MQYSCILFTYYEYYAALSYITPLNVSLYEVIIASYSDAIMRYTRYCPKLFSALSILHKTRFWQNHESFAMFGSAPAYLIMTAEYKTITGFIYTVKKERQAGVFKATVEVS